MTRARDVSRLITTPPNIYATDSETSAAGYLTNASASSTYLTQTSASTNYLLKSSNKIVQIVYDEHTESKTSATSTYIDTGLTATITPTSASNEIIIMVSHNGCAKATNNTSCQMRLMRGSTQIAQMSDTGGFTNSSTHNFFGNISIDYKDAPATTSAITYKTQFRSESNNADARVGTNISLGTMILIEVTP